jgi:hypothetical protein
MNGYGFCTANIRLVGFHAKGIYESDRGFKPPSCTSIYQILPKVTRSINANVGYIYKTYRLFYYPRGSAVFYYPRGTAVFYYPRGTAVPVTMVV